MDVTQLSAAQGAVPVVAILAGGQSRRMGSDKAQLLWNGVSWLERTARVSLKVASRVIVIGRQRPLDWTLDSVVFLEDSRPNIGPLGGLFTALSWLKSQQESPQSNNQKTQTDALLLLACDMPLLQPEGLAWLAEYSASAGQRKFHHGSAVKNDGRLEPLFSVYSLSCLPLIEAIFEQRPTDSLKPARRFSLNDLIESADFEHLIAPPAISAMLCNLNTPQDIDAATRVDRSEETQKMEKPTAPRSPLSP